jgi:phenylacetate-CoA ligase
MLPPFDLWRTSRVAADVAAASYAGTEALTALREQRLAALLSSAARDSPLYRRVFKGRDPARVRLQDLPVMCKPDLMHSFNDWVTDPELRLDALRRFTADPARIGEAFLGRYAIWESSGSTGESGIFVQDGRALAVYDALEALRRPVLRPLQRMLDPWSYFDRTVFVGAIGGHFASTVSIERLRRLNPALSDRLRGVSFLQPIEHLVAELQSLAPTVLATYPSAAVLLAEERLAGRLRLDVKEIWTGGETMSAAMRNFVQQAFGCRAADSYGMSEFLSLASECRYGSLHLNSDWAILESVDERYRAMPTGRTGATTLLTNLANHVQPLIRYDVGDRVTVQAEACACGSPLPVIQVSGRCDETLRLGQPGTRQVSLLPLAVSTVLEDEAGLFDFQLIQEGPCELLLQTGLCGETGERALRRARAALVRFIERQGASDVRIRCRSGATGERGKSGKVQRVIGAPIARVALDR